MPAPSSKSRTGHRDETIFLDSLSRLFRENGWEILQESQILGQRSDLVVSRGKLRYAVNLKMVSEPRRDRLLPQLALEILRAESLNKLFPRSVRSLPVLGVPELSPALSRAITAFMHDNAPNLAVGVIDGYGSRLFLGNGLEGLTQQGHRKEPQPQLPEPANLFSDLNQWMLKVLLAPLVSPNQLHAPRIGCRNATELAAAAEVSVMSAFRCIRELKSEGYLDERSADLRLVRRRRLMQRWQAANLRTVREVTLRWILPTKDRHHLANALRKFTDALRDFSSHTPRVCLGAFSAAEELGIGFVRGVPQSLFVEVLDQSLWKQLGLTSESADQSHDVYVRVPSARESVFRGSVRHNGVMTADIIQTWLDVSCHPSRGKEQAEQIEHRLLGAVFSDKS